MTAAAASTRPGTLTLLAPAGVQAPTGGNIYDRRLVDVLRDLGVSARLVEVPGPWPDDSAAAGERLCAAAADAVDAAGVADGSGASGPSAVLIDGLLAAGCPQAVGRLAAEAHLGIIAHLPAELETGLPPKRRERLARSEAQAMRAAHVIVCPSRWTAEFLSDTYGLGEAHDRGGPRLVVAHPGTDLLPAADRGPVSTAGEGAGRRARAAAGAAPPAVTCLAALTPRKNTAALVEALAAHVDRPWSLTLCGPDDHDPGYAARLRARADAPDVRGRVTVRGAAAGADLEELWRRTDLLVLPSLAETFGMVVTEALVRGVPAVVTAGTGAQEALGLGGEPTPGAAVDLTDLPRTLGRWLLDERLRADWATAAARAAERLPTWRDTARAVASAFALPAAAAEGAEARR